MLSDVEVDDLTGQSIKGYTLDALIGEGGFGAVYRARQAVVSREVAIKIILPRLANHPDFIRRFEAEAQMVARLEHPHIVPLYDFWREPSGAYLVMRYLRGGSMKDALNQATWEIRIVIRVVRQLAAALKTAHQNNIIHRDIKPANILLDDQQNAYLGDFGIAKDYSAQALTSDENTKQLVGSPAYTAPEWIKGEQITVRSDLYNFAILTYELLTGSHPFVGRKTPLAMLNAHIHDPVPHLRLLRPDLPDELNDLLQKATAKNPDNRYESVEAFERAFLRSLNADSRTAKLQTRELMQIDLEADLTPLAPQALENPYKGLRAFQEIDSKLFFGREKLTQQLIKRLQKNDLQGRFLAVVGASGGGKSSLVRAGLLAALRRGELKGSQNWFYVDMLPSLHPMEELEAALLRVAVNPPSSLLEQLREDERGLLRAVKRALPTDEESQLVLFIDQFEEVFTLVQDNAERIHFLDSLCAALNEPRGRLRVIITLRADFYDRPLLHPQFSTLMRACTEVVVPLSPEELERAISAPAKALAVKLESGLVSAMVAELSSEPGALPLLQYALTELFDRRENYTMKLSHYHEIGGALGALARRADELYAGLDTESQEAARQLFLHLITLGEGTGDTRRRVVLEKLAALDGNPHKMQAVIDLFGQYRLLTFDRDPQTRAGTVEVAHEAILREWGQLKAWLDASREDIRQERRLAGLAAEWIEAGYEDSFLLRGVRLDELEHWAADTTLALTPEERAFLNASLNSRATEHTQEIARRLRETRLQQQSRNRLRFLIAVLATVSLIVALLFAFVFRQQQSVQTERDNALFARQEADFARSTSDANAAIAATQAGIAERQAQEMQSLSLISSARSAFDQGDPDLALALTLEAAKIANAPQQVIAFVRELSNMPGARGVLFMTIKGVTSPVWRILPLPDGNTLITSSGFAQQENNRLSLWQLDEEKIDFQLGEAQSDLVLGLALSPDGETLLSGGFGEREYHVWELSDGDEARVFSMEDTEFVLHLAISPDEETFLSASTDSILRLRDFQTGRLLRRLTGHTGDITAVAYRPDSQSAVSASTDGSLILWDLQTGDILRRFAVETGGVQGLALSPDGQFMLYALDNGDLVYANLDESRVIYLLKAHTQPAWALDFSSDGSMAVSGGMDGRVIVWDMSTGKMLYQLNGHHGQVNAVAFSADDNLLYSGDVNGEIREWDLISLAGQAERPVLGMIHWLRENRYVRPLSCEEKQRYLVDIECGDIRG